MNAAIIVGKDGRPSQKHVFSECPEGSQLGLIIRRKSGSKHWFREYKKNGSFIKKKPNQIQFPPILIRWGTRQELPTDGKIVYNSCTGLEKATDKKRSREIFMEKGVPCPKLVTPSNHNSYPVIARPLVHSKGKNFHVLKNKTEFTKAYKDHQSDWYFSEFIDKDSEFRVHVAHGKVLEVMQKPKPSNPNLIAWNRALNGDPFVRVGRQQYSAKVCAAAIKAVKALGLDFGGVDVIVKDGNPFVVEVNTSPTLNSSPLVCKRYARYFSWLAFTSNPTVKKPHWNTSNFKKGPSFAWKNEQFANELPTTTEENE